MSKKDEALKMALEKVQEFKARWWKVPPFGNKVNKATREAITYAHSPIFELEHAIREALADHIGDANKMVEQPAQQQEPELEPDAWDRCEGVDRQCRSWCGSRRCVSHWREAPPQPSKPLTDEQIAEIAAQGHQRWIEFARAIEAAHGITGKTQ